MIFLMMTNKDIHTTTNLLPFGYLFAFNHGWTPGDKICVLEDARLKEMVFSG